MRFSKILTMYTKGGGHYLIGSDNEGETYAVFSLIELPDEGSTIKVVDGESTAIVPLNMGDKITLKSIEDFRDAINQDKFILIYSGLAYQNANQDVVDNIFHDILKYRHMYVARESGNNITRATDAYNARQFLNQYRSFILNTNGYGVTKDEKAPYLRFIDGEDGAFDLLRRYENK